MLDRPAPGVGRVHEVVALLVGPLGGVHRADDGQLVGVGGEGGQVLGVADAIDVGVDGLRSVPPFS